MNTQEVKQIAKKLGVKSVNMDKGELIRAIQAAEGIQYRKSAGLRPSKLSMARGL